MCQAWTREIKMNEKKNPGTRNACRGSRLKTNDIMDTMRNHYKNRYIL